MKKIKYAMIVLLTVTLASCESDKSRIEKCNDIVRMFVANLTLENYDLLYKNYPDFQKVKKYWKINDFKIDNTTIDDDKTVSIMGTSQLGNILFILKKQNGKYIITNSKGLSAFFNTHLYTYCKEIGYIGVNNYDKDISRICSAKEDEFNRLVYSIKNNIETNVSIKNNNLSINFRFVSGDVTVKNYSRFSIPKLCYEIYFNFLNSSGQIVFTKKESNYDYIPYGQSITKHLFESISGDFQKIDVELKLTSAEFIENIITENVKGNNCIANSDF